MSVMGGTDTLASAASGGAGSQHVGKVPLG